MFFEGMCSLCFEKMSEYENKYENDAINQSEGPQEKFHLMNPVNFYDKEDLLRNESFILNNKIVIRSSLWSFG